VRDYLEQALALVDAEQARIDDLIRVVLDDSDREARRVLAEVATDLDAVLALVIEDEPEDGRGDLPPGEVRLASE